MVAADRRPGPGKPATTIRTRVIVAVVALTAFALALTGGVDYLLTRSLAERQVMTELGLAVDEFRTLATEGLDPATGAPFADAASLLRVGLQRTALGPAEGALGIVDGAVRWTAPPGVELRLESDPEFLDTVLPLAGLARVSSGSVSTALGDYRYVVVPVLLGEGAGSGALVRAVGLDVELRLVESIYRTYVLVALGSLVLVGGLIWLFVGRLLEPLTWVRRTAREITDTDLSRRIPVRGNDDLSELTVTVNAMLDRLEAAVGDQRRLLDDVGHELRTPLTIVRGHLELLDARDPDDVAATKALVMGELDRMRRMVDDLLTLARAERPDFVTPHPTEVARLTDETLAKATTLGARHWVLDDLADVQVSLDPQRVTQAWLQLAANAVQYSAEGSTVGMGSRADAGELRLWVRDEGVGIATEDQQRVLSRWGRGRGTRGTGLGLAIVDSIARAHHGRVAIESQPGRGSTISLVVPLAPGMKENR